MVMNVAYVTRVVDLDSPVYATQVEWIRRLAENPRVGQVTVLAGRVGRAEFPSNVAVVKFGVGYPGLARFMWESARLRNRVDFFFVAQGGPFPALLLPAKLLSSARVFQWKAHAYVSPRMRFYANYCDDLVFTATESSLPIQFDGKRVVGHTIDADFFKPQGAANSTLDLLSIGRVTPIKGIERAVRVLGEVRRTSGTTYSLDIVGPVTPEYQESLEQLAATENVADSIRFLGKVPHREVPELIQRYRATLNLGQGALDKSALESLSCGVPVLTSNPCTMEILPPDLAELLTVSSTDDEKAAATFRRVLSLDTAERNRVGGRSRALVVSGHSIADFFDKVLDAIEEFQTSEAV